MADGTPAPPEQWAVQRALRGEVASSVEYRLRRKDTGESWVGSYSFAPIRAGDGTIVGSVVSGRDVTQLMQIQADLAAAHTTLQRLMADHQRVQEDERKRIARELHDGLQQQLAAIRMDAIAVGERLAKGKSNVAALLNRIDRLSEAAIASTRRMVSGLRPEMLEELGLVSALEALCAQHAQRTGSDCQLEASPAFGAHLDGPPLSIGLYRIAQEALNNVAKHAKASRVKVSLDCSQSGLLQLRIVDDGIGMRPRDTRDPESFGLLGMAERVRALGGQLRIEAQAGQGTMIEALVPVLRPGRHPANPTEDSPPSEPPERHSATPGLDAVDATGRPLQTVIDALDGKVAVLDKQGVIQLVNRSWRDFAARHGDPDLSRCGPGVDYLAVCRRSALSDASAGPVLRGLRAVLEGEAAAFVIEYPCDTPAGVHWFRMHAASVTGGWVILTHADIHPSVGHVNPAVRALDPPAH
jgi:signal transduction histidine kinase